MSEDAFSFLGGTMPEGANRGHFDRRLNEVEDAFVEAALHVVESMPELTTAFLQADTGAIEDARQMGQRVSQTIREVEDSGFVLLARESPVGRDLRRLVAILRLSTDVERSASLLRHVAEAAEHLDARLLPEALRNRIRELSDRATDVLQAGIDAWRSRDGDALADVDALDEMVDELQLSLLEDASQDAALSDELMVIGLIARYFERIADHGVALAKDVAFVVTGERVTTTG